MSFRVIADVVNGKLISKWLTSPSKKQIANDELKKYRPPCVVSNLGPCISTNQENCVCLKMANTAYLRLLFSSLGGASMTRQQAADMNKIIDELARRNSGSSK